jgi:hypothetical protein
VAAIARGHVGWFGLDDVTSYGRPLTILWDRDGSPFGRGAGLTVLADGEESREERISPPGETNLAMKTLVSRGAGQPASRSVTLAGLVVLALLVTCVLTPRPGYASSTDALSGTRHRVLIASDIGGTDPDDFQSMVHLFLYADVFDLEGIVSSPYGPGRKEHILKVTEHYEKDFPNLKCAWWRMQRSMPWIPLALLAPVA